MFVKIEIFKKCHLDSPVTKPWRQRCQRGTKARRTSGPGSKLSGSVCRKLKEVGAVNTCPIQHFSTQLSRPDTAAWHSYRFSASVCPGCTAGQPVSWVVKVSEREERELGPCCVWRTERGGRACSCVSVSCKLRVPARTHCCYALSSRRLLRGTSTKPVFLRGPMEQPSP